MSADIWLEEDGERVVIDPDPDAEMRSLVPRRTAGGWDDTTFNLTYNLTSMHAVSVIGRLSLACREHPKAIVQGWL